MDPVVYCLREMRDASFRECGLHALESGVSGSLGLGVHPLHGLGTQDLDTVEASLGHHHGSQLGQPPGRALGSGRGGFAHAAGPAVEM